MSEWLTRILAGVPGSEKAVVDRFTNRLLDYARRQLPERLRRRVDPEDVVQSVYRSFFGRLQEGRFAFEESHDVWRLLAVMTFHKARNAVKHHQRERRDVRRDLSLTPVSDTINPPPEPAAIEPGFNDLTTLYDSLERLLRELPENYRTVVLRRLEGDSIEEIAQRVQRSRRTVLRILAHLQELAAQRGESPS